MIQEHNECTLSRPRANVYFCVRQIRRRSFVIAASVNMEARRLNEVFFQPSTAQSLPIMGRMCLLDTCANGCCLLPTHSLVQLLVLTDTKFLKTLSRHYVSDVAYVFMQLVLVSDYGAWTTAFIL